MVGRTCIIQRFDNFHEINEDETYEEEIHEDELDEDVFRTRFSYRITKKLCWTMKL